MTKICQNCESYQKAESSGAYGTCRINPPVLISEDRSGFPGVRADDWCRQFEHRTIKGKPGLGEDSQHPGYGVQLKRW